MEMPKCQEMGNGISSHTSVLPAPQSAYQQLAKHMKDVSGDRGVLKEVIRSGHGENVPYNSTVIGPCQQSDEANRPEAAVTAPQQRTLEVKYSGYLEHADKPFDTNCFHRHLKLMKLGEDITLAGMEIALLTMQRGELSRFLFSPSYAYGKMGCPPLIPRLSTVLFEMELLDFLDTAQSDHFCNLTKAQQATFPLDTVLRIASTEREFGNYLFKRNRFYDAKDRYKRASSVLSRQTSSDEELKQLDAARLLVALNLSLTYLRLDHPSRALTWGQKALTIDDKNPKALFRCGRACLELREYEASRDFLVKVQKLEPFNLEINSELKRLESCYQEYMDKQRDMCCRMFFSTARRP